MGHPEIFGRGLGRFLDQRDKETVGGESAGQKAERTAGREAIAEAGGACAGQDLCFRQHFDAVCERNLPRAAIFGEHGGDHLLILFGFERAGGVNDVASGAKRAQRGGEDCSLALGVARKVFGAQAVADFGIASKRSGAAAGNIGENKIEGGIFIECGCVGKTAFDVPGIDREALA